MPWQLVLSCLLAAGTQAFTPAPLRWGGAPARGFVLAPRALPNRLIVPSTAAESQSLTIWDAKSHGLSRDEIPNFAPQTDDTITWASTGLCIEASGDRKGDVVNLRQCTGAPTQKWEFLPWSGGAQIQLKDTQTCIEVDENEGGLNGATVMLGECEGKLSESWDFEDILLPTQNPAAPSLQRMAVSLFSIVALGAVSLAAWLWRTRQNARAALAMSEIVAPSSSNLMEQGVSMAEYLAWRQDERMVPGAMRVPAAPADVAFECMTVQRAFPQMKLSVSSDVEGDVAPTVAADISSSFTPKSKFLKTMIERGFFNQCTDIEGLDDALSGEDPVTAYLGFDATASSLHVGSLLQIMILRHFQRCGHRPLVLVGGGTTKVGDPSGKDESRQMLDEAAIESNIEGISSVFSKFLSFESDGDGNDSPALAKIVNNDAWLATINYLEFLRNYGPHFTINRMMSFESVKLRLEREQPLTFLEFNYMILQAYDFLELNRREGCLLQFGGSDQWGNILNGIELTRKVDRKTVFGMTAPLITTSDGKKMGKSASGAVWLNSELLSPYDYWQFWRNTADADVERFLKLFTELDLDEVARITQVEGAAINDAKVVLADECTALLHGREALVTIKETAASMFASSGKGSDPSMNTENLPRLIISAAELSETTSWVGGGEVPGKALVDVYIALGMAASKAEAKRLIKGGGARVSGEKVMDEAFCFSALESGTEVIISAGKKKHGVLEVQ